MGGVAQSSELIHKVRAPDEVFVNTNREELLQLLSKINDAHTLSLRGRVPDEEAAEDPGGSYNKNRAPDEFASPDEEKNPEEDEDNAPGKFTDEEIEQLFQPFKYLFLSNRYLGDEAVTDEQYGVISTMHKNKYLYTLDLSYNYLTDTALEPLVKLFMELPRLHHLSLGGNSIGERGCRLLAGFLASDPTLEILSLFNCELTDSDCLILLNGLVHNTHLKVLNLDFNYCTWKFLRALIDLVKLNETLSVVLFQSIPHDPETLQVLPQDTVTKVEYPCTPAGFFRSWQTYYHPEGCADDVERKAAAERFFLRRLVCKMDFTGLKPFPPTLLVELEKYLGPRRAAYEALLDEERERELEKQMQSVLGACRASVDVDAAVSEPKEDEADEEIVLTAVPGDGEPKPANLLNNSVDDRGNRRASRHSISRHRRRTTVLSGSIRRELPPLNSPQRLEMVMKDAYLFREKLHGTAAPVGEKVLPNGFDRVWMAPIQHSGTKSINFIVNQKPSLLKACWCDPHDGASAFAGRLHYHCRQEEFIDYSHSKAKKPLPPLNPLDSETSKKPNNSTSLDSVKVAEKSHQKQEYHGCQGTGHRCRSIKNGAATGAHVKASAAGPPRDSVMFTNRDGLTVQLHYNPVTYFTSPYQPCAAIVNECPEM